MIRLGVTVAREEAPAALSELLAFSPNGVEEVDVDERLVEFVLYGAPGELPSLHAVEASVGDALVLVRTSEIADDWPQRWRDFHQAVAVGDALRVRPPWLAASAGPIDVVIEPAQAFGTGAHASTQLCLELLVELAGSGAAHGPLVDLGSGSGVLAIAAAKLGWEPVVALDYDPEAVCASAANARANGVALDVRRFDLRSDCDWPFPSTPYVLTANLLAPLLAQLAERAFAAPRSLIASGLLREQLDAVADAFAQRHGLAERARRVRDEWGALLLCRP